MQVVERARQGMSDHSEEYTAVRERWAAHMNEAFREANIEERVDHRSLASQGVDRQPMVHVPMEFYRDQVKGLKPGELARLREDYRARVAARLDHSKQRAPAEKAVPPAEKKIDPRNIEEIRQNAVQAWLRMRSKEAESSLKKEAGSEDSQQRSGEQRLPGDRSTEGSPARDTELGRHAEHGRRHDPDGDSAISSEHEDDASI
jgi:hypothetical protein